MTEKKINPPCTCYAHCQCECGCDHDWTNYAELAEAWATGYVRGVCDEAGDCEPADNPFEDVYGA